MCLAATGRTQQKDYRDAECDLSHQTATITPLKLYTNTVCSDPQQKACEPACRMVAYVGSVQAVKNKPLLTSTVSDKVCHTYALVPDCPSARTVSPAVGQRQEETHTSIRQEVQLSQPFHLHLGWLVQWFLSNKLFILDFSYRQHI